MSLIPSSGTPNATFTVLALLLIPAGFDRPVLEIMIEISRITTTSNILPIFPLSFLILLVSKPETTFVEGGFSETARLVTIDAIPDTLILLSVESLFFPTRILCS